MEPISILIVGLSIGTIAILSWNLHHARTALQNVSDRTLVLSESQGAHAKQTTDALLVLQKKIDHYDTLVSAMRATQPEVDHGIRAFLTITELERDGVASPNVVDALDAVFSSISLQDDASLSPMQSEMASRLFKILDSLNMTVSKLNLNGRQSLQVGLCLSLIHI